MGRPLIVVGDKTSHGGTVIESTAMTDSEGKPISRVGHKVTCPKRGHGTNSIATGDNTLIIDGKPVTRHGDTTACGATLISSQIATNSDPQSGGDSAVTAATTTELTNSSTLNLQKYDEQAQLVAPLIEGLPYFIETSDGRTLSGRVTATGDLPRVDTSESDEYTVHWGDEAIAKIEERQT